MPSDVPFIVPDLPAPEDLLDDFGSIARSGRYSNFGSRERAFAAALAAAVGGGTTAVTFSSATAALEAALLGTVGRAEPGDVVILPSFTFLAAGQIARNLGYRLVFVDIGAHDLQPDPDDARRVVDTVSGRVRAILTAQSFGIASARLTEWERLAAELAVPLIVDSAAGFGARHVDGRLVGAAGTGEVFSFHATKPLAVGEGGALVTRDADFAERARAISNFGLDPDGSARMPGINGKLSELHAAIGLRQLERLDGLLRRRREVFDRYRVALPEHLFPPGLRDSPLAFLPLRLDPGSDAGSAIDALAAIGVEARRYYYPALHRHPVFGDALPRDLPVTDDVAPRMLALPCHPGVTPEVVAAIAEVIGR